MASKKAGWLVELAKRLTDRRPDEQANYETGTGEGGVTREATLKRLGLPPDKPDKPV